MLREEQELEDHKVIQDQQDRKEQPVHKVEEDLPDLVDRQVLREPQVEPVQLDQQVIQDQQDHKERPVHKVEEGQQDLVDPQELKELQVLKVL